jgi:hypothetical protein
MIAVESAVGRTADPRMPYGRSARPVQPAAKHAAWHPHPDTRIPRIIGGTGIGTISTHRRDGDIRDSGCPTAVRTDKFRAKPVRKMTSGALAITWTGYDRLCSLSQEQS